MRVIEEGAYNLLNMLEFVRGELGRVVFFFGELYFLAILDWGGLVW
jgi:hypothetical protein